MIAVVYELMLKEGVLVQRHRAEEQDIPALREELKRLREESPSVTFILTKAETPEECLSKGEHLLREHMERQAVLDALPPVRGGEMTKAEWDASMAKLDVSGRHYAANMAAHSWAVLPHENGVIVVGHYTDAILVQNGQPNTRLADVPAICQTCDFTRRWMAHERHKLVCHLAKGNDENAYDFKKPNRTVDRASTCDGWKAKAK